MLGLQFLYLVNYINQISCSAENKVVETDLSEFAPYWTGTLFQIAYVNVM